MRSTPAIIAATVLAVGVGAILGTGPGPAPADAATFTVTPEQLQINQRISQAAVERSNTALNYLRPIRTSAQDTANNQGVQPPVGTGWTTAQIANQAVTQTKLANNAVGSAQIQNGSVTAADLAPNANVPTLAVASTTSPTIAPGNSTGNITVTCPTGAVAVSGGFSAATPGGGGNPPVVDQPSPTTTGASPTGWTVNVHNNSGVNNTYTVYAVCAS